MMSALFTPATGVVTVRTARRFSERALGLIVEPAPARGHGLFFERCSAVHTCFMRYAIDVVFVDREDRVLSVRPKVRPWRLAWCRGAYGVLELSAGEAAALGIQVGWPLRRKVAAA